MHPIFTVGVLVIHDGRVLLVSHREGAGNLTGTYGLPSGHLEKDEKEKTAAVRELREETGIVLTEEDLIEYPNDVWTADIKRKDGKVYTFSIKVFVAKRFGGELRESDETTPEWVDIAKLNEYNLLPNVKEIIMKEVKW
jgi:8-oxo-dGTP pyrophosphatase MutT (NUDIX family)